MYAGTIRKYIDLHGPIIATRSDGAVVKCVASFDDVDHIDVEGSDSSRIEYDGYGLKIYPTHSFVPASECVGYFKFSDDLITAMNRVDLEDSFDEQLRQLLPAVKAQLYHYRNLASIEGYSGKTHVGHNGVKVYGLISPAFRQTHRGSIFVSVTNDSGLSACGHRIQGYMFYDGTIKFDSIQAWRVNELSWQTLKEFDPEWADLVNPYGVAEFSF